MTAAIGRIVQETGSRGLTPEGAARCHEAMTALDSYLTLGRSGLPANLDDHVGCLASRSWPHCAWSRKRIGQWAGRRPSGSARGGSRYNWSARAYERPMIRPSGD
jgi:hypothetical protein